MTLIDDRNGFNTIPRSCRKSRFPNYFEVTSMALADRVKLYTELEALRNRPLLVYVTSPREGAEGQMSADVIPEICDQFEASRRTQKGWTCSSSAMAETQWLHSGS